ncbi:hypothetical protein AB0A73_25605 [Glycomyces sp. NPDC047369]
MSNTPRDDRRRWLRRGVNVGLVAAWLIALIWLMSDAALACVYPDPLPGGCPADEARALARFDLWFVPVLLAGPAVILGVSAGLSPQGQKYKAAWYALAILLFCAAPSMFLEAAVTGFAVIDRELTQTENQAILLRLIGSSVIAIGAPAGLAFLTHRRGYVTYAKVWAACSIVSATMVLVAVLPAI